MYQFQVFHGLKACHRKMRLDKRHAKIAAARGKPDEGEIEETAQEKLERDAGELTSQLKKAERAEAQALEKDQKDKAKCYSQRITSRKFLKKPKAVTLVETKKRKKSMKMGNIGSAEEEDEPDDISTCGSSSVGWIHTLFFRWEDSTHTNKQTPERKSSHP